MSTVLQFHLLYFINITPIYLYNILGSNFYVMNLCVIHFKCYSFDLSLSVLRPLIYFTEKEVFMSFLHHLRFHRATRAFAWFSEYNKFPPVKPVVFYKF